MDNVDRSAEALEDIRQMMRRAARFLIAIAVIAFVVLAYESNRRHQRHQDKVIHCINTTVNDYAYNYCMRH